MKARIVNGVLIVSISCILVTIQSSAINDDMNAYFITDSFLDVSRGELDNDHSLSKPYEDVNWMIEDHVVASTQFVRLTGDIPLRHGSIRNIKPFCAESWEVDISLRIHGKNRKRTGNGMAVWFLKQEERRRSGSLFGYPHYFKGLGIFIDTTSDEHLINPNHEHPFISAMVNNGSLQYVHDALGTHSQLGGAAAGCRASFLNKYDPSRLLVRYAKQTLSIFIAPDGSDTWKLCLQSRGVHLPREIHLAISASTGPHESECHDLLSVKTYTLEACELAVEPLPMEYEVSAEETAAPRFFVAMAEFQLDLFRTGLTVLLPIVLIAIVVTYLFVSFVDHMDTRSKRML